MMTSVGVIRAGATVRSSAGAYSARMGTTRWPRSAQRPGQGSVGNAAGPLRRTDAPRARRCQRQRPTGTHRARARLASTAARAQRAPRRSHGRGASAGGLITDSALVRFARTTVRRSTCTGFQPARSRRVLGRVSGWVRVADSTKCVRLPHEFTLQGADCELIASRSSHALLRCQHRAPLRPPRVASRALAPAVASRPPPTLATQRRRWRGSCVQHTILGSRRMAAAC